MGTMLPHLGDNVKGIDPHTTPGGGVGEIAGCSPTSSRDLQMFTDPSGGMFIDIQKVSACRHYDNPHNPAQWSRTPLNY